MTCNLKGVRAPISIIFFPFNLFSFSGKCSALGIRKKKYTSFSSGLHQHAIRFWKILNKKYHHNISTKQDSVLYSRCKQRFKRFNPPLAKSITSSKATASLSAYFLLSGCMLPFFLWHRCCFFLFFYLHNDLIPYIHIFFKLPPHHILQHPRNSPLAQKQKLLPKKKEIQLEKFHSAITSSKIPFFQLCTLSSVWPCDTLTHSMNTNCILTTLNWMAR